MPNNRKIVGDEEHSNRFVFVKIEKKVRYLRANGDVQRRDRLISDDHIGAYGERASDCDSLLLTAAQLGGPTVGE